MPEASGTETYGSNAISIDASNTSEGYVMIRYTGSAPKVQVQIHNPDGSEYDYPLEIGEYHTLPLTGGDGTYQIDVLENVTADMYSIGLSQNYISFITNVYNWVIENVSYDTALASNVTVNYIPDVDATYASKKGICFDYASLMTSMLRLWNVPCKMVFGYVGEAYHAWISVYTEEEGWVDAIWFDGMTWHRMDPTFASAGSTDASIRQYIGNGKNYEEKYVY